MSNEALTLSPRRSLENDENVKIPTDIGQKLHEYCSSLSSYPGMSGGSILRCKMDTSNERIKTCVVIGTLWGAERVFINNTGTEEIEKFGCFINKKILTYDINYVSFKERYWRSVLNENIKDSMCLLFYISKCWR